MTDLPHGFLRWKSYAEFAGAQALLAQEWRGQQAFQQQWLANARERVLGGWCAACGRDALFALDGAVGEEPNWRESLTCNHCGMTARWRSSAHLYALLAGAHAPGPVYMTEQATPLHALMRARLPGLIGSEYLGPGVAGGALVERHGLSLRHEDVTALSMADASLGAILSFDVLEHVPDWRAALREFARTLKPGGLLLLTAPFHFGARDTVVRARIGADGGIEHLLPPVYHGDPLSTDSVLCYQEFAWDLLDALAAAGFARTEVISCWSAAYGYLGGVHPFIVGWR